MQEVFDYAIPSLHPLAIHFPIAFLLAGAAATVWFAYRPSMTALHMATVFHVLGLIGAIAAKITGESLEDSHGGGALAQLFLDTHEDFASYVVYAGGITVVGLLFFQWMTRQLGPDAIDTRSSFRWGVALMSIATAMLVAYTGHLGAVMVWGVAK
jgi:uncharacterized membrane protein